MFLDQDQIEIAARELCDLFEVSFGGKPRGRYRISEKFLRHLMGCTRLYPETIMALQRAVFERGFVLIDMDTFFVIIGAKTLSTYRRVGPALVGFTPDGAKKGSNADNDSDE